MEEQSTGSPADGWLPGPKRPGPTTYPEPLPQARRVRDRLLAGEIAAHVRRGAPVHRRHRGDERQQIGHLPLRALRVHGHDDGERPVGGGQRVEHRAPRRPHPPARPGRSAQGRCDTQQARPTSAAPCGRESRRRSANDPSVRRTFSSAAALAVRCASVSRFSTDTELAAGSAPS